MNRRNMLSKVRKIIEMARKKKYYCHILSRNGVWYQFMSIIFFFFSSFLGCWKLNVGGCRFILYSMAVEWTQHHHHFNFEKLNACPFFFSFFLFELEWEHALKLEKEMVCMLYDASEAFQNGFYTIRFLNESIEHWTFTIHSPLR